MATVLLVWAAAALFFTLSSCQVIPEVALESSNCPVGPGVKAGTVLIGTEAYCRCVVARQGDSSTQARWFRQNNTTVGAVNATDGSSLLTFSFNASDLYQNFECRPITASSNIGKGLTFTPQFRRSPLIVGKQNFFNFEGYPAPNNVTNITWQVSNNGQAPVNISTCNIASDNCTDYNPELYQGYSFESGSTTLVSINHIMVNETQFFFVADNGLRSPVIELEIYAWPSVVFCSYNSTPTYVDFTCNIWNVYPSVIAELHREKEDFNQSDFEGNATCNYGPYGSGFNGDYSVLCNWRIKMTSMWTQSNVTAYMSAPVSNVSAIDDKPETIKRTIIYTAPRVQLVNYLCDGLNGELIKRDAQAKCKCQTIPQLDSPGRAVWYTNDNQVVGDENMADWSSTLTFSFNASDPAPTYTCMPFTELQVHVDGVTYEPKFSSSMPQSLMTGMGPMIIVLGVVFSGIVSR